ncbi:class I SAM-dependent methyltransferase [Candidatus Nephthysia bennettiae]
MATTQDPNSTTTGTVAEAKDHGQNAVVDYAAVKARQRLAWQTGDYPRVGVMLQLIAERLVEAADIRAGQSVLDVACGQGNAALAAARRNAQAAAVDYAPNLLQQGRERAAAEHLQVDFKEADAENLPFPDASFDLVLSTVGVMFAPNQERTADELVRVTRRGGQIALANWEPRGMGGDLFNIVARYAPPPPGIRPVALWGNREHLAQLFGARVNWTSLLTRDHVWRFRSPEQFSAFFREHYGPITRAFAGLDEDRRQELAADLTQLAERFNTATDGTLVAPMQYLEAVGTRR